MLLRSSVSAGLRPLPGGGATGIFSGRPDGALLARCSRRHQHQSLGSEWRSVTVVLEAAGLSKHFQAKRGLFSGGRGGGGPVGGILFLVESGPTPGVVWRVRVRE